MSYMLRLYAICGALALFSILVALQTQLQVLLPANAGGGGAAFIMQRTLDLQPSPPSWHSAATHGETTLTMETTGKQDKRRGVDATFVNTVSTLPTSTSLDVTTSSSPPLPSPPPRLRASGKHQEPRTTATSAVLFSAASTAFPSVSPSAGAPFDDTSKNMDFSSSTKQQEEEKEEEPTLDSSSTVANNTATKPRVSNTVEVIGEGVMEQVEQPSQLLSKWPPVVAHDDDDGEEEEADDKSVDWEMDLAVKRPWDDDHLFTFPTVEERIKYYMGGWYHANATINLEPMCKHVIVHPRLDLHGPRYGKCLMLNATHLQRAARDKAMGNYQHYAQDIVRSWVQFGPPDMEMILSVGDGVRDPYYPVVLKSRYARQHSKVPLEREPVLALMNEFRHYRQVTEVLSAQEKASKRPHHDAVFWRGVTTGRRIPIVDRYIDYNRRDIDVAFSQLVDEYIGNETLKPLLRPSASLDEMLTYKFLLSLEGNDVATGLKWMLYASPVVLMPAPTRVTWAMEDLLIPFVHYIPLREDASDLPVMLDWARRNPMACRQISWRATQFMWDLYVSPQAKRDHERIFRAMAHRYHANFADTLKKCHYKEEQDGGTTVPW